MMLEKSAPSRRRLVVMAAAAYVTLSVLLAACNKPQDAAKSVVQSAQSTRFLYVVNCSGRVDKLDTRERKLVSSFTLAERSGTATDAPAVPSLASSGGQMDGCLAQRVLVDAAGTAVSLIAPKDARLDSNGLQDFQALTFALPQWTLTRTEPAGKLAVAPWLQRDAAGKLRMLPENPSLATVPLDLREFKGAANDIGGVLLQSSGDVSLLSLLLKDSTQLALGIANAKTRTLTTLPELPPTTLRHAHLAPGGGFVLIEATSVAAPNQRTGALRLADANGKTVADLSDERVRNMAFIALTPNGLAVYADAAGAYHFVSLGQPFGATEVVQSPLAAPSAAPAPALVFAAE